MPQAICTRYGLTVGATMAPVVRVLLLLFYPISYPISKVEICDHVCNYSECWKNLIYTGHSTNSRFSIGCLVRDMLPFWGGQSSRLLLTFMEMRLDINVKVLVDKKNTVPLESSACLRWAFMILIWDWNFCAFCCYSFNIYLPSSLMYHNMYVFPHLGWQRRRFNAWWDDNHSWCTWVDWKDCKRCHDPHIKGIFPWSGCNSYFVGLWIL